MNLEGRSCRVRGDKWTPVERKMKLPSCLAEVQKKRLILSGSFLHSPEFFFFNDTAQTPPSCSLSLSDVPCFIDSPLVGAPSATSNSNYSHARQRKVVCWVFKWGIWSRVYLHHSFICIYRGNICWCLAYIAPLPCVWAFSDCKSPDTLTNASVLTIGSSFISPMKQTSNCFPLIWTIPAFAPLTLSLC